MIVLHSCYSAITPRNFKVTQCKEEGTRAKMELNDFKSLETKQCYSVPREILTNTERLFPNLQQLQSRKHVGSERSGWNTWVTAIPTQFVVSSCIKCLLQFPKLRVNYRIHTAWPHQNISWSSKSHGFGFKNKQTRWWWSGITSKAASFCTIITGDDLKCGKLLPEVSQHLEINPMDITYTFAMKLFIGMKTVTV